MSLTTDIVIYVSLMWSWQFHKLRHCMKTLNQPHYIDVLTTVSQTQTLYEDDSRVKTTHATCCLVVVDIWHNYQHSICLSVAVSQTQICYEYDIGFFKSNCTWCHCHLTQSATMHWCGHICFTNSGLVGRRHSVAKKNTPAVLVSLPASTLTNITLM